MSVTGASRKLSTTLYCGTPASCMMIWMVVAAVVSVQKRKRRARNARTNAWSISSP